MTANNAKSQQLKFMNNTAQCRTAKVVRKRHMKYTGMGLLVLLAKV